MLPFTAPIVMLGQITSAAFAAGLNFYLTVALVGVGARFNLLPNLPSGLRGIETPLVIISALALYLVEFVVDKVPRADSVWDAVHTIIRPLGTGLLTLLALEGSPPEIRFAGAAFAALIALGAHGGKALLRLALNRSPRHFRNFMISIFEDLCAAAVAAVAFLFPLVSVAVAAAGLLILLPLWPRLFRVAALVARAVSARIAAFFTGRGWRSVQELPPRMRRRIDKPPLGRAQPRAIRAALKGVPGVPAYRTGWLVLCYDRTNFLYKSWIGYRTRRLSPLTDLELWPGSWTDVIQFRLGKRKRQSWLFLLKDGPDPEVTLAGLNGNA